MQEMIADLVAEQQALDRVVASLTAEQFELPSSAEGWLVRDCVAHLAEIDDLAAAIAATRAFPRAEPRAGEGVLSAGQLRARALAPAELVRWWRAARDRLAAALAPA